MKKIILLVIVGLIVIPALAFGQEVYQWVDERGTVHFTDDLSLVPEKYRDQVQQKQPTKEPTAPQPPPPQSIGTPKRMEVEKKVETTPVQKDILGRGEEWWRGKAKEWNEKLISAQRNYEKAHNEWKTKEQELEASKLKPDSLKRKLKAEIKILEEKAKDWEKQMEEAKNMLENVLPKQAEDDRANPDWLKIEDKK